MSQAAHKGLSDFRDAAPKLLQSFRNVSRYFAWLIGAILALAPLLYGLAALHALI